MADQPFDRDELVAEIRKELGVRVERSDPILAASVVNDFMLRRTLEMMRREMKAHISQQIAASAKTQADAEKEAIDLINRAGGWADKKIIAAGEAAAIRIEKIQTDAIEKAVIQLQSATRKIDQMAVFFRNVGYALGGLMIAAAALWVGVKIGYMLPLPAKH